MRNVLPGDPAADISAASGFAGMSLSHALQLADMDDALWGVFMALLKTFEPLQGQALFESTEMKIKELSAKVGLDAETIRYYEREGLIPAVNRQANGYRSYSKAHLERLAFIRHCRALDMTLSEIRALTDFADDPVKDCSAVNQLIDVQLKRVSARLASIQALEKQLIRLRKQCRKPGSMRQCGILHELVAAAHDEALI